MQNWEVGWRADTVEDMGQLPKPGLGCAGSWELMSQRDVDRNAYRGQDSSLRARGSWPRGSVSGN